MPSSNSKNKKGGACFFQLPLSNQQKSITERSNEQPILSFKKFYEQFKSQVDIMESFDKLHPDQQYAILFYMIASSCTPTIIQYKYTNNTYSSLELSDFNNLNILNIVTLKSVTIDYLRCNTSELLEKLEAFQKHHYDQASLDPNQVAKFEKYKNYDLHDLRFALFDLFSTNCFNETLHQVLGE